MPIGSILVLESPWDSRSVVDASVSVFPFVSEFARACDIRAFHQSFADKTTFRLWVHNFHKAKVREPKLLYVAAHGSSGRIGGLQRSINGETIAAACRKAKSIRYVHFGSCLFGTDKNLRRLLGAAKQIRWAAGYEKQVDWIDSTLLDIMVWGRIVAREKATKGWHVQYIAKRLLDEIPGLADNLGFRFHYRHGRKTFPLFQRYPPE